MERQRMSPGLYKVMWNTGGSSLVSIGMGADGTMWFAPTNWIAPSESIPWDQIKSYEKLNEMKLNEIKGGYKLEAYMKRVVKEKEKLDEKIVALGDFIKGGTFKILSVPEKSRLRTQLKIMVSYSDILMERIVAAGGEAQEKFYADYLESIENG